MSVELDDKCVYLKKCVVICNVCIYALLTEISFKLLNQTTALGLASVYKFVIYFRNFTVLFIRRIKRSGKDGSFSKRLKITLVQLDQQLRIFNRLER